MKITRDMVSFGTPSEVVQQSKKALQELNDHCPPIDRRPFLENWFIMQVSDDAFCLTGSIFNDERFDDGTNVTTSRIKKFSFEKREAETRNTYYRLGEPDKLFIENLKRTGKTFETFGFQN